MNPAGIEPASQAPQAYVLSVELRVLCTDGRNRTFISLFRRQSHCPLCYVCIAPGAVPLHCFCGASGSAGIEPASSTSRTDILSTELRAHLGLREGAVTLCVRQELNLRLLVPQTSALSTELRTQYQEHTEPEEAPGSMGAFGSIRRRLHAILFLKKGNI